MATIYIVEDDENIRDLIQYALESDGHTAHGFAEPQAFWDAMKSSISVPDLILLDRMLPNEDGISILKRLRANVATKALPIILVTAKDSEYDRVKGLDSGADDYITKPFSVLELLSRVRALLRRTQKDENPNTVAFAYKNVELNADKYSVYVDGQEVPLTHKEFQMLWLMMENPEIVITRERFLSNVWESDWGIETRTVDMHIKTLRQKLGHGSEIIQTIRGVGYKVGEKI
ncbi:MAG: response regulator transcription factor [Clostridiales Family XIII bacterium]|jgi:two-component system alkaline phosphatase synthesis response regulator PhoP|nr:response regulator transcription factor [Clostridiales Family XIII bacterium]